MEERATLPRTASRFAPGRRGRAAVQRMAEQFAEAARALAEAARVSAATNIAAGCVHGILSACLYSLLFLSIVVKQGFHAFHTLGFLCIVIREVEVGFWGLVR